MVGLLSRGVLYKDVAAILDGRLASLKLVDCLNELIKEHANDLLSCRERLISCVETLLESCICDNFVFLYHFVDHVRVNVVCPVTTALVAMAVVIHHVALLLLIIVGVDTSDMAQSISHFAFVALGDIFICFSRFFFCNFINYFEIFAVINHVGVIVNISD